MALKTCLLIGFSKKSNQFMCLLDGVQFTVPWYCYMEKKQQPAQAIFNLQSIETISRHSYNNKPGHTEATILPVVYPFQLRRYWLNKSQPGASSGTHLVPTITLSDLVICQISSQVSFFMEEIEAVMIRPVVIVCIKSP